MTPSRRPDPAPRPPRKPTKTGDSRSLLPLWVTVTVVLVLLGLFVYSVVVFGPAGYPVSMMVGGLFGAAYGGLDLLKRRRDNHDEP